MISMEEKLSIVIISKDTRELIKDLLESINKDKALEAYIEEVVLVDNASADGTDGLVKESFPNVIYIRNDDNMGFAASANKGIASSGGEYIMLLNSDTLLIEGEICKMLRFMAENQDVGICGPQLVYPDMKLQRSFAYVPSLLFEIIPRSFLELLFPGKYSAKNSMSEIGNRKSEIGNNYDVPSLIGAAIMIRRTVLEALGGFDERFFFFLEETDLCVSAKSKGHRVVFYPGAKVIHLQGKTVGKNWVKGRIEYNISLYKFIKKHQPFFYFVVFVSLRLMKSLVFLIIYSILSLFLSNSRPRRTCKYYLQLFLWHLRGCPENAGLRRNA